MLRLYDLVYVQADYILMLWLKCLAYPQLHHGHQTVFVYIKPRHTIPPRRAFVDLGVVNIIVAWIEGDVQPIAFSGRPLLADWYYWTNKISYYQSIAKRVNNKNTTRKIKKIIS